MAVAYISHSDCGRHDTGWGHPEHPGRLRAIPRAVASDPALFGRLLHAEGRHATRDELALAHDRDYIAAVEALARRGGGRLDADTVVSEGSWDAATAAVGCALTAVDMVLEGRVRRAHCAVRPPGHHALRAAGMGFCIFGNVAVAALYARASRGLARVLIVDWDVHHGNGTQALVQDEAGIRFVSLHQWPWYPGSGASEDRGPHRTIWNVPMPPARPPQDYVDALLAAVDAAADGFVPELVLVSAGFDALRGDPLGGFTLELEHVTEMTRAIVARADVWCEGRVVTALEGGYAPVRLGEACAAHLRALE
ncbi:MAG: histone deacetylase family protein [Gemmatimonadaceae bacterium]